MKSNLATLLSLLLLAVIPLFGQIPQPFPFMQYSAAAPYKGKSVPLKLTSRSQREFRTVLRKGAQKRANFAGHYTAAELDVVPIALFLPRQISMSLI
jgi:hypothetical protein